MYLDNFYDLNIIYTRLIKCIVEVLSCLSRLEIASLGDARGITEVHCSDVDKWYKWKGGKKVEASYEELSVEERFLHGGPWMSIETCAIHLNYVLNSRQYPLIAKIDKKL